MLARISDATSFQDDDLTELYFVVQGCGKYTADETRAGVDILLNLPADEKAGWLPSKSTNGLR